MRDHILGDTGPIVVHGPVGCGKTAGIRSLAEHLGFEPVATDTALDEDSLLQLIEHTLVCTKTAAGSRSLLVIDDFEGFTPLTRTRLAQKMRRCANAVACVVVCSHVRDPAVSTHLKAYHAVRLRKPPYRDVKAFFETHCEWQAHDASPQRGFSSSLLFECAATLATGDLRRAATALAWRARMGKAARFDHDAFLNPFDATRQLLLRKLPFDEWGAAAEARDVALLQHHLPFYATDLGELADALDVMTETTPLSLFTCALAARVTSRASSVQALAPPKPPRCTAQEPPAGHSSLSRRTFATEVPSLLRATSS